MKWIVAPFTWTFRVSMWFVCLPVGVYLSYRKGRNKRHQQLLEAARQPGIVVLPQPSVPRGYLPPSAAVAPPRSVP